MVDGAEIAARAAAPDAEWGSCDCCGADRRLVYKSLCHACSTDPVKRELVAVKEEADALRDTIAALETSNEQLVRAHRRLQATHARYREDAKGMRRELDELGNLRSAHTALALTEDEYLTLVSIMIDARADDPTIPILAICRKLDIEP